ncbi:MAG: hypothetical protein MJZ20_03795 [Bacteroidaceae bacterium]|nr:hypothetical protein [Bacteroidaceae bacterium]
MADGEVRINTKLDTSGVDKGVKELKAKIDSAGKSIDGGTKKNKGFSDSLNGIKAGAVATAAGVAGVAVAVKKTIDVLNDCAAAYRVQKNAEEALQIAAKNNPYLNSESVYNLRNFAGELQKFSEVGDEVSIKVMSQLAAAGRNEEQIMQIMRAAVDMAAATGQDIGTAAQQLNATLNGNAGALGRQIAGINNLTKAELESGKAIELVAKQYKGMAQSTADVEVQLSNAWGDFKENIGRGWQNVTQPVKQFFLDVLSSINEVTAKTNDLSDAAKNRGSSLSTAAQTKLLLDENKNRLSELEKISALNAKIRADSSAFMKLSEQEQRRYTEFMAKTSTEEIRDEMSRLTDEVRTLTIEYGKLSTAEKTAAEAAAKAASEAEKKAAAEARDKAAAEYIAANTKAIEEQVASMELRAEISGEEIDTGELYNAYLQSYIELLTKSNGLVTANNKAAKERLEKLTELAEKAKDAATAEERLAAAEALLKEADKLAEDYKKSDRATAYKEQQEHLREMRRAVIEDEVADEKTKADRIKAIDEEMAKNRRELISSTSAEINDYAQKTMQVLQDASDFALRVEKNRMDAELADLEIKYRKGELSEEEYQDKVAAAKKKGAKIQYQIEMAQWASNILSATANTAVGVTQALAQGGVAGIVTGALVGAAGAVQLASIMAAKPIPHFASGGFVGGMNGASMGADNTTIAARGGELMVNAAQQRELWDVLNGNSGSLGNVNLIVNNSASNIVNTRAQIDKNKIELMIDARIDEGLKSGRFNAGLNAANASMSGDFYGI